VSEPKHILELIVDRLSETLWFILELVSDPIKTVLAELRVTDDKERFKKASYFLGAMLALWFVVEIPIFLHRGIKPVVLSGLLFIGVYLVLYFFIALAYSFVLHVALKVFCVKPKWRQTIPCYFYTSVALPLFALLNYAPDLTKYRVIDKAGSIQVLLRPGEYSQTYAEVVQQSGRGWEILLGVSGLLVSSLSLVVFVFLSVILSKWYRKKLWRCLVPTLFVWILISAFEQLALEPLSAHLEVLVAMASSTKASNTP